MAELNIDASLIKGSGALVQVGAAPRAAPAAQVLGTRRPAPAGSCTCTCCCWLCSFLMCAHHNFMLMRIRRCVAALHTHTLQAQERLVEITNGCICCTLRGDLAEHVGQLAAEGRYDYCVIESTGIGEPMQVWGQPHGRGLAPVQRASPTWA